MTDFSVEQGPAAWRATVQVLTAHVVMLRDTAVLDDPVAAALLTALDAAGRGEPEAGRDLSGLLRAVDQRLDALTPVAAVGTGAVGRQQPEVVAAVSRLLLRAALLELAAAANMARRALIDFAAEHVFTLMPAYASGLPVQPTSLAHYLGGTLGPLGRGFRRLRTTYAAVNQSPLGAGAMVSSGLPLDRERAADLLGFDGLVESTFDAVAAVDMVGEAATVAVALTAPVTRFAGELLAWLRAEPSSFRLDEEWLAPVDGALPQFRPPVGIERLRQHGARLVGDVATVSRLLSDVPYGPAVPALAASLPLALDSLALGTRALESAAELFGGALTVNRAYLANRAGRDYTTTSELADFLITEEALPPGAARNIALMTVRQAMSQGIEASGITPAMVDGNALLVIGRELGVEIERMQRALAPRRFLEKRTVPGGPAPEATRDYLDLERARLLADDGWLTEAGNHLTRATEGLMGAAADIIAEAD